MALLYYFFGQALFKMTFGRRAEKVAAVGVSCICFLYGSYVCHVHLGMVHRLEGVALIFSASLCALNYFLALV